MALIGHIETASKSTFVDATLTDFGVVIDISMIDSAQWALIRSDGGNLRLADGSGTEYPTYVEAIDTGAETGIVKGLMPTASPISDTDIRINIYDLATTALTVGDVNGRNNTTEAVCSLTLNEASGSLIDISGNGNDGTLTGTFSATGIVDDAVEVSGASLQQVAVSHDAALNPGSGDMTWNLWFASDDAISSVSVLRILLTKGRWNVYGAHVYIILRGGVVNGIYAQYRTSSSNNTIQPTTDYSSVVGDGDYHMVSLVADGSTLRLYLDGDEIASGPKTLSISPSAELRLGGGEEFGSNYLFDGRLDNYSQWGSAKSAAYLKTTYNNINEGTNFFTTPVYVPAVTNSFMPQILNSGFFF